MTAPPTSNPTLSQRLESLEKIGVKLGLKNMETLLEALGNPQNSYPSILIAGTNGKGSVGAMLHAILSRHGYRTGYYTSPHLVDIRERIKVEDRIITVTEFESELALVFRTIDDLLQTSKLHNIPTYFETITAVAFHHFRNAKIDFAVVEVGLGGRYDATNVIRQSLSIIASIDFDHEEFLGQSMAEIAAEKAGILKEQSKCVTGWLHIEARDAIEEIALQKQCAVVSVDPAQWLNLHLVEGFPVFEYQPWGRTIRVNLCGRHQAHNAAVALLACDILHQQGITLRQDLVTDALNEVRWPGRLEILSKNPLILIDCAHNPMGVRSLQAFLEDMGWGKVVALFTAMRDKRILPMLEAIAGKTERLFLTRVEPSDRCATLESLTQAANSLGLATEKEPDTEIAFRNAHEYACGAGLPLVIFGSIYLIGEILRLLPRPPATEN